MKKSWLKELARDLLALGSIPFYVLVIARLMIRNYDIVYQMLVAAIFIFISFFIIKNTNLHVARSFVILIFINMFYNSSIFSLFSSIIWLLIVVSAYYLSRNLTVIVKGIVIGLVSSLLGYYLTPAVIP